MALRVIVLVVVLTVSVAFGFWWRRRDGRVRSLAGPDAVTVTSSEVGHPLGERATLLQVSSQFCAPCRSARRVLTDAAGRVPGVRHLEVDAADQPALVRRLNVLRTPSLLVLDAGGRVVHRASGVPRTGQVLAVLAALGQEGVRV
jgi:thiol-disulfide isomerase/thioredoxin